jgi:four helix bundle protein
MNKEQQKQEFKKMVKTFILDLVAFIDSLPPGQSTKIIGGQLLRSGTSVGTNYFEAIAASSKKDFINYFSYSLKSANETCFWLDILIDSSKCNKNTGQRLLSEARELSNILAASIITMKSKNC